MDLHARYHALPDQRWFELLGGHAQSGNRIARALKRMLAPARDPDLPKLPPDQLQANFVGSSGDYALREAFQFYQVIKQGCRDHGRPLTRESRILDFGCGWGRITRFFLKDVPGDHVVGIDVDPDIIEVCRSTVGAGRFQAIDAQPPTNLPDESFDVIFAYSVFSHLAEPTHQAWITEFARLLRSGGLLFATTRKRSFIDYCNGLTEEQMVGKPWVRSLGEAFRPREAVLARFDADELVYSGTGGGGPRDASFYGETAFSEGYARRTWAPRLQVVSYDAKNLDQALIIGRKPETA